jgi:esterase/lipase superfamily enzyme
MASPNLKLSSILILAACLSTGCSTTMMPTPVSYYGGNADPLASVPAAERKTACEIYVFTDREPSGEEDPESFYSDQRSREGRLAIATVDLAKDMDWDTLHRESIAAKRDHDPVPELTGLEDLGVLWTTVPPVPARLVREPVAVPPAKVPAERFLKRLNAKLEASRTKDITILVHGFDTEFDANQVVAAQLHHYLGRDGVFMSYSWPSEDGLLDYVADKGNAAYSVRMFREFLKFLADHTVARRINLLGHSAGAPIVVGAVRELRLRHWSEDAATVAARYRIGQLVLVAPDLDLLIYVNAELDGLEDIPDRLTVYVSTEDKALFFSHLLFDFARLGEPLEGLSAEDLAAARQNRKLDVVNVTNAEDHAGSFLGHSYFHQDPWVSADLLLLLGHGVPARERGLDRANNGVLWTFPDDYPDRVKRIAAALEEGSGRTK